MARRLDRQLLYRTFSWRIALQQNDLSGFDERSAQRSLIFREEGEVMTWYEFLFSLGFVLYLAYYSILAGAIILGREWPERHVQGWFTQHGAQARRIELLCAVFFFSSAALLLVSGASAGLFLGLTGLGFAVSAGIQYSTVYLARRDSRLHPETGVAGSGQEGWNWR
jgi:hypothetical protein